MAKIIITGLIGLFLVSFCYSQTVKAPELVTISALNPVISPIVAITERFGSTSPMLKVAACESKLRQFLPNGDVLISPTHDHGVFQINHIHIAKAKSLGMDIDTLQGNIDYAEYLYKQSKLDSWYMSKSCWSRLATVM